MRKQNKNTKYKEPENVGAVHTLSLIHIYYSETEFNAETTKKEQGTKGIYFNNGEALEPWNDWDNNNPKAVSYTHLYLLMYLPFLQILHLYFLLLVPLLVFHSLSFVLYILLSLIHI